MMEARYATMPFSVVNHSWSETSICDADGERVALLSIEAKATEENQSGLEMMMATQAEFIVRACNSYADLKRKADERDVMAISLNDVLRMLEAAHRQLGVYSADNTRIVNARAALAAAGVQS